VGSSTFTSLVISGDEGQRSGSRVTLALGGTHVVCGEEPGKQSREAAGRRNLARSGAQKNERQKKELAATSAELSSGAADHQQRV